ncbi:MAG: hypothetical protein WCP52_00130 [Bacteroidota bacterium]
MAKKEKTKDDSIRIRNIQEWLLQGQLVTDICRNIIGLWSISEKEAIQMIADAFDDFTKRTKKSHSTARAYHVQLRLSLYKKAVEAKQFKTALQILQDLAKIESAYYPEN